VECVGAQKKFRDTAANHCQFQTIERITVSTRMIHSVFRAPPPQLSRLRTKLSHNKTKSLKIHCSQSFTGWQA